MNQKHFRPLIALVFLVDAMLACVLFETDPNEKFAPYDTAAAMTSFAQTEDARLLTPNIFNTEVFGLFPTPTLGITLSALEGTAGPTNTKDPNAAAQALQAMLVPNGPPDIPGWDGENELELADETHLVFYLPEDWMYEKAPYYYADLMPQYGWEMTSDGIVSEGNTTTVVFVKDNRTATIVISIESDRRVKVAIEIT